MASEEEPKTPEELRAYFDKHGFYYTKFVPRKEIRRFPRYPRQIESHSELTELIQQGQGFVFNNRDDRKLLHRVTCESLEVMSTSQYQKLFFEDLNEAKNWLDRNYGPDGWVVCGRCRY